MRGQLAMEFVFLVAVAFMIFLVYTASTRQDIERAEGAREYTLVKDLAYAMQSEINRVGNLEDGYKRTFEIPATLDGKPYSTTIINSSLIVNTSDYEAVVTILDVNGNLTTGSNTIEKTAGQIYLNQ